MLGMRKIVIAELEDAVAQRLRPVGIRFALARNRRGSSGC